MSRFREQVAAALMPWRSAARPVRLAGRGSRPMPASLQAELDASAERRTYLVACLREELYTSLLLSRTAGSGAVGEPEPVSADPWLVRCDVDGQHAGAAAGSPAGPSSARGPGRGRGDAPLAGERRTEDADPRDGRCAPVRTVSLRPAEGARRRSRRGSSACSARCESTAHRRGVVRVYWNVGPAGAAALVLTLTTRSTPARCRSA